MSDNVTVARPYAKAIFLMAKSSSLYSEWGESLLFLSRIINNKSIQLILRNPMIKSGNKANFIISFHSNLNEDIKRFVKLLAKYKRLLFLPEVYELYDRYRSEEEKTLKVTVESAVSFKEHVYKDLVSVLSKRFDRNVSILINTREDLIGGVKVRAKDKVIDSTVRERLASLQDFLIVS